MTLGTNIKASSDCVRRIRIVTPVGFILQNNAPLKLLVSKLCPFNNFKLVIDILMALGTNIKPRQTITVQRNRTITPQFFCFRIILFSNI